MILFIVIIGEWFTRTSKWFVMASQDWYYFVGQLILMFHLMSMKFVLHPLRLLIQIAFYYFVGVWYILQLSSACTSWFAKLLSQIYLIFCRILWSVELHLAMPLDWRLFGTTFWFHYFHDLSVGTFVCGWILCWMSLICCLSFCPGSL